LKTFEVAVHGVFRSCYKKGVTFINVVKPLVVYISSIHYIKAIGFKGYDI